MKTLVTFEQFYKISEGVISPLDFSEVLELLKRDRSTFNTLEDINLATEKYGIKFADFDTFYGSLEKDIEKKLAPKELVLIGGVKFALFNKYQNTIMIVVEPEVFLEFLRNSPRLEGFLGFLKEVLRHESIHLQQVDRMKDKSSYVLDSSPTHNAKKYWTEKREMMAYAQTLLDHLADQGLGKEEILKKIQGGEEIKSWVWNVYSKVLDPEQMKLFRKYLYQYWERMD